jgi:nucleoside-diphosphate-sugar epimerase
MDVSGKVFVTGATGFIGTRLVQALTDRGERVRALSRRATPEVPPGFGFSDGGPLARPGVELVRGDITDRESLLRGMEGCDRVFHLAAYAKNWAPDPAVYDRMNVEGMHNVFDAAEKHGVRRVVWTSTQLTFGPTPRGQTTDEETPRVTDRFLTDYERTKTLAERQAIQRAGKGLPLVIVNPGRVYGPGLLTEGNSVSLLIDQYDRGLVPILLNRGVNVGNWVLVDDVVQGHLLAMEKGRVGQRYMLGGENASLRQFFRTLDQVSGRRHFQVPTFALSALGFAWFQKKRADWFGIYPQITPGWVRTFITEWSHSSQKAERELGYRPTPLAEGLRITYEWLQCVRKEQKEKS